MAMSPDDLAKEIQTALGQGKQKLSDRNKAMAKAIIDELQQNAKVMFAPGTITGTAPPGSLTGGAGQGGIITCVLGPSIAARLSSGLGEGPPTPQLIALGSAIATHIMTAQVNFATGKITGTDTNTSSSPGVLAGQGSGGKVAALDGDALASLVAPSQGGKVSDPLKAMCKAIVAHIQKNAEVSFPTGSVVGVAPPGGGPLSAGAATGGLLK